MGIWITGYIAGFFTVMLVVGFGKVIDRGHDDEMSKSLAALTAQKDAMSIEIDLLNERIDALLLENARLREAEPEY